MIGDKPTYDEDVFASTIILLLKLKHSRSRHVGGRTSLI